MHSQFAHAFANGSAIAEIARFDLPHANTDARLSHLVANVGKPDRDGLRAIWLLITN